MTVSKSNGIGDLVSSLFMWLREWLLLCYCRFDLALLWKVRDIWFYAKDWETHREGEPANFKYAMLQDDIAKIAVRVCASMVNAQWRCLIWIFTYHLYSSFSDYFCCVWIRKGSSKPIRYSRQAECSESASLLRPLSLTTSASNLVRRSALHFILFYFHFYQQTQKRSMVCRLW